jgi:hypothetical protein
MGRYLGPAAVVRPISRIRWRVVMTDKHGDYFLHELELLSSDRGSDVVRKLGKYYEGSQGWLSTAVPFMLPVVYTTTLSPVRPCINAEDVLHIGRILTLSQVPIEDILRDPPCMVDIEASPSRCHILTKAIRDTGSLSDTADFIASYSRFAVVNETTGNIRTRDALLVCLELNKLILLVFITVSILSSAGFGALAGICRHNLDTGLGVFGAILGVIGIVEGLLTWLLK